MNMPAKTTTSAYSADTPWWQGAVIYQIYPRSFRDSNGDGVGDLEGIIAGLDHVAGLGVDAIWLSPFFTSPMDDFGYDIADYCDVDPLFGTLADFDRLIARAHGLGLKVIIDQVYSHTSDQHSWFKESRTSRDNTKADWYVWADPKPDGSPPSNWQSVFGGPSWEWDNKRGQYYLHNFLTSQPDLNVHNPDVQAAILDVARFWLDRGVDGFRLDALNFAMHDPAFRDNPAAPDTGRPKTRPFDFQVHSRSQSHPDIPLFIERIRAVLNDYDDIFTVAEVGGPTPLAEMKAFTAGDNRLLSAYDFSFLYADELSADIVRQTISDWQGDAGEGWPSWAFSNHDAPRAVSRWASAEQREQAARLHMLLIMCLRGNTFIYQGDELALPAAHVPFDKLQDPEAIANWPHTLGRDSARTPLPWQDTQGAGFSPKGTSVNPWLPIDPRHLKLSIANQQDDANSMLQFTRRMTTLRKTYPALQIGDIAVQAVDSNAPELLVFWRSARDQKMLCIFNLSTTDIAPLPKLDAPSELITAVGIEAETTADLPENLPALSGLLLRLS